MSRRLLQQFLCYQKKMTRNTIGKTFQKKKGEQQRLKKRFLDCLKESKNSSGVFKIKFSRRKSYTSTI